MRSESRSLSILQTPSGIIASVTMAGVIGYAIWIFTSAYDHEVGGILSGVALVLIASLEGAFGLSIAFRKNFLSYLRRGWFFIALSAATLALTYGVWTFRQVAVEEPLLPGLGELLQAIFYPLLLVGLMLLPAALVTRQQRGILYLDLIIVMLGFSMVFWYLLPQPSILAASQDLGVIRTIIYPLGDFLILAAVIALLQRDLPRQARWVLAFFAVGMMISAAADLLTTYFAMNAVAHPSASLQVIKLCAGQSMLFAAAKQISIGSSGQEDGPSRSGAALYMLRLALPYLVVAVGLGLLVKIIVIDGDGGYRLMVILYGALVMVALVLLRQYLVLKENVRLYQAVQRIAWTDGLTGLYNRHFFNEVLPKEMERAKRYHESLGILILDIDGFKKYNDSFGHLQGDLVLKSAARVFAGQLRASDTIARFGGDEFVIVLPSANRRLAQTIAKRIQQALANQVFNGTALGVSVGVAVYRSGMTPEQLLEEADNDLYRHKAKRSSVKG